MHPRPRHLRIVQIDRESNPEAEASWGDLALVGALLAINTVPVAGELLHPGHWGSATLGFATLCLVLAGRELVSQVRDLRRARG